MLYPNPDILYYTAIGDAYCLATEFIKSPKDDKLKEDALNFKRYLSHPKHGNDPGTYSDDTHMSIANTEVLLQENNWTKLDFANAWVNVFKRDPRNAYSRGFQKLLEETNYGFELLIKVNPISKRNGAAMRSVPLGVLPTPKMVLEVATRQASITHNTTGGLFGSQAVALMSHFALHENLPFEEGVLRSYLRDHLDLILNQSDALRNVFLTPWGGRVAGEEIGIVTATAVFTLIINCNSLLEILEQTIKWGGDTDSVAAIALGIASTRLPDDLPAFMHNQLEVGSKYGSGFLKLLGDKLMRKFCETEK